MDKTRRSIEDVSCNTSPDSGINNSDGRHFLSSSSSSSQIEHPNGLKSVPEQIDSPPLSEYLPKTPSPTASPTPVIYSSQSSNLHQNLSSIPLKYQRQSKSSSSSAASEKHYKKKFRERTEWEYDFDMEINQQQQHKSSKFRPKGKGWGWNSDSRKNNLEDSSAI